MERNERPTGAGASTATDVKRVPPSVDGVEHSYIDLPGLRMHIAEAGAGSPVLLLHGSPMHWWEWHKVVPGLARHHRVICPDLRGSGWTDAPPGGYTRDQMVADVVALLDALGLDQVDLVSHDMGAIPGYGLCWDHSERVVRHVAIGVVPLNIRLNLRMLPRFRHVWHQEVLALSGLGPALVAGGRQRVPRHMLAYPAGRSQAWSPEETEVFLAPLREPERAHAKSAMYRRMALPEVGRILGGRYRSRKLLTPTLVLVGEADPVFSPDLVRELLQGTENCAEHVELVAVTDAAHHLPAEAPGQVVELTLRFFAGDDG